MHNEPSANSGHGTPMPVDYIYTLSYKSAPIRFALIDNQPWFVAADVCKAIGAYDDRHGAAKWVRSIPEDQKTLCRLPRPGTRTPAVLIVSESGLDKLLWLALHSVSEAWSVLSSVKAQVSSLSEKKGYDHL